MREGGDRVVILDLQETGCVTLFLTFLVLVTSSENERDGLNDL